MLATASRHGSDAQIVLRATAVEAPAPSSDSDPFFPPSHSELSDDDAVQLDVTYHAPETERDPLDELGLAIARAIIEHHGGKWSVDWDDGVHRLTATLPSLAPMEEDMAPPSAM
jgi:hypothetical protein